MAGEPGVDSGKYIWHGQLQMVREHHLGDHAVNSVQWVGFELNGIDEHSQNRGSMQIKVTHRELLQTRINTQNFMQDGYWRAVKTWGSLVPCACDEKITADPSRRLPHRA